MKSIHQVRLELENFEKLALHCENDCSLGMIYDYACALGKFAIEKMNEVNASLPKQDSAPAPEEPKVEPQAENE